METETGALSAGQLINLCSENPLRQHSGFPPVDVIEILSPLAFFNIVRGGREEYKVPDNSILASIRQTRPSTGLDHD